MHNPRAFRHRRNLAYLVGMTGAALGVGAPLLAAGDAIDIGSRRELFVDRYLIETLAGAELRLQTPQPAEVVLRFDRPWEGRYSAYVTVFQDGPKFRMYYRGLTEVKHTEDHEVTCCAESTDGVQWTRPSLGLFEVGGTKENNVVLARAGDACHNFSPFLDTKPETPAAERYKALGGGPKGLVAFGSPDGLRWHRLQDRPVFTKGVFDSQNVPFWSEAEGCYVCYFRTFRYGVRWISRTTSKDFLHWSEPAEMSFGKAPAEHLYTNQTQPYFRAPHIYIGTAARFMPGRQVLTDEQGSALGVAPQYRKDCSDGVLLTSRGGMRYDRTFLDGFVRPGPGPSNWSSRTNYPACGVVPTGPAEMSMYVQRDYGQPTHHLRRYTLRTDGFASVHASRAGGEMTTKLMRFAGKELTVNFATSAAGGMRVEIQDEQNKPVPGFTLDDAVELIGDEIERVVSWKNGSDVGKLAGRPIRLRFAMKDADLYSLRFR